MKVFPFVAIAGLLGFVAYAVSKQVFTNRLSYFIQDASLKSSGLALLLAVSNAQARAFTQKSISADVYADGKKISTIYDNTDFSIAPDRVTPQRWLIDLPAGVCTAGVVKLVRIKGTVSIDNIQMPLDLRYKFL